MLPRRPPLRSWLLGLLVLQSMSSVVLDSYQGLLKDHLVVTLFLTMLVRGARHGGTRWAGRLTGAAGPPRAGGAPDGATPWLGCR